MKRSEINAAWCDASTCFLRQRWALPPTPRWDITDFGLRNFTRYGLTLVNLATEPEYCEKLMYARRGQTTPCHTHAKKKEDIICRAGELTVRLWAKKPANAAISHKLGDVTLPINGKPMTIQASVPFVIAAGSRITLAPGIWHEFYASSDEAIIGEVSTANDDLHDNFFLNPEIGRFPGIEEDEPALIKLING